MGREAKQIPMELIIDCVPDSCPAPNGIKLHVNYIFSFSALFNTVTALCHLVQNYWIKNEV